MDLIDRGRGGKQLCDQLQAKVVVSSSWRHSHRVDELVAIFGRAGLSVNVVGCTPQRYDFDRGREIADYMAENGLSDSDVLILEDAEEVDPFEHRTVRPWFCGEDAGFRARQYEEAMQLVESG